MADPAAGFIQGFADGKLQAVLAAHFADYRQTVSVGRPVCPMHILQHLAWGAARQRHARQGPVEDHVLHLPAVEQDGHLAGGGDGQDLRPGNPQRARLRAAHAGGENFAGFSFPGGAVHDGLPIGREARHADDAPAIGQQVVERRRSSAHAASHHEGGGMGTSASPARAPAIAPSARMPPGVARPEPGAHRGAGFRRRYRRSRSRAEESVSRFSRFRSARMSEAF